VYEKRKVKKEEARNVFLTPDQYLKVPLNWCAGNSACWAMMVDKSE